VTASIIVWPDTGDYVTGMPEHINEKKNKTGNGSNGISKHGDDLGGYRCTPGFVKYREAKGTSHDRQGSHE
jgi:hypothetical protein